MFPALCQWTSKPTSFHSTTFLNEMAGRSCHIHESFLQIFVNVLRSSKVCVRKARLRLKSNHYVSRQAGSRVIVVPRRLSLQNIGFKISISMLSFPDFACQLICVPISSRHRIYEPSAWAYLHPRQTFSCHSCGWAAVISCLLIFQGSHHASCKRIWGSRLASMCTLWTDLE